MYNSINLFDTGDTEQRKDFQYTAKTIIPQYVPNFEKWEGRKPMISDMIDKRRYLKLVNHIRHSNVSEDVKDFLILAATRHIVYNYANIADYYALCTPEEQRLFEESALVLIDVNDAIANGYVKFSKKVEEIMKRTRESDEK